MDNFQQVQPGEKTCANTPSFPMLRTLISLASLQRLGSSVMGCLNSISVRPITRGIREGNFSAIWWPKTIQFGYQISRFAQIGASIDRNATLK